MKPRSRIIVACGCVLLLVFWVRNIAAAYGYDFVFPGARRSAVGGYTYADPDNPSHLAYDYRFSMHTRLAAAQKGWVAVSRWDLDDDHESTCTGQYDDRGNFIILNHTSDDRSEGTGLETWYFHLSNNGLQPAPGAYFSIGKYMAQSGDTGCGGPHLHFAAKNNNIAFDPYVGSTNWLNGQPLPMGYKDQDEVIHGPYAVDNTKIREKWFSLEGSASFPGSPLGDDTTGVCTVHAGANSPLATQYLQRFERGYISYCGSGGAVYTPYTQYNVPDVFGRYTCGAGANSVIVVENVGFGGKRERTLDEWGWNGARRAGALAVASA